MGKARKSGGRYKALARKSHRRRAATHSGGAVPGSFVNAYTEAALWSSMDNSDDSGGEPLDKNYSVDDIAPSTMRKMCADCTKFYRANRKDIEAGTSKGRYDGPTQAGHDFWLTRNGHGAGFWDGDWPEPAATRLTKAAKGFGEFNLYVGDDGKIYG